MEEVGPGIFMRRGPERRGDARERRRHRQYRLRRRPGRRARHRDPAAASPTGSGCAPRSRKRTDKPITPRGADPCPSGPLLRGRRPSSQDKPVFIGHARSARGPRRAGRLLPPAPGRDPRRRPGRPRGLPDAGAWRTAAEIDLGDRAPALHRARRRRTPAATSRCAIPPAASCSPPTCCSSSRIPSLDGSLVGWLKETERLGPWARPGPCRATARSRSISRPALDDLTRYLTTLRDETRKAIAADVRSRRRWPDRRAESERGQVGPVRHL